MSDPVGTSTDTFCNIRFALVACGRRRRRSFSRSGVDRSIDKERSRTLTSTGGTLLKSIPSFNWFRIQSTYLYPDYSLSARFSFKNPAVLLPGARSDHITVFSILVAGGRPMTIKTKRNENVGCYIWHRSSTSYETETIAKYLKQTNRTFI